MLLGAGQGAVAKQKDPTRFSVVCTNKALTVQYGLALTPSGQSHTEEISLLKIIDNRNGGVLEEINKCVATRGITSPDENWYLTKHQCKNLEEAPGYRGYSVRLKENYNVTKQTYGRLVAEVYRPSGGRPGVLNCTRTPLND
jgi:hypothetical protein